MCESSSLLGGSLGVVSSFGVSTEAEEGGLEERRAFFLGGIVEVSVATVVVEWKAE